MTETEKLEMLEAITGETDEAMCSTYLAIAGQKILRRAYPFDNTETDVPAHYAVTQVQIAAYLLNKRGGEGEISHVENGVSRSYEDGDVPPSLLREVIPFTGRISKG